MLIWILRGTTGWVEGMPWRNRISSGKHEQRKENASQTQQGQERVCSAASIIVYINTSG